MGRGPSERGYTSRHKHHHNPTFSRSRNDGCACDCERRPCWPSVYHRLRHGVVQDVVSWPRCECTPSGIPFNAHRERLQVVWHFGAVPGFSTLVSFLPADNFGAVLLANTDEKQDENLGILFRLVDEALELPAAEDRKSTRLNSSHSGESRMPSSA